MPTYTSAKYYNSPTQSPCGIEVLIDGVPFYVPLDPRNPDYSAMMSLVSQSLLTVAPAS